MMVDSESNREIPAAGSPHLGMKRGTLRWGRDVQSLIPRFASWHMPRYGALSHPMLKTMLQRERENTRQWRKRPGQKMFAGSIRCPIAARRGRSISARSERASVPSWFREVAMQAVSTF